MKEPAEAGLDSLVLLVLLAGVLIAALLAAALTGLLGLLAWFLFS